MAKIEIKMMQDFSDGSTIKHKLCAELLFVLEKHKTISKKSEKKQVKRPLRRVKSANINYNVYG